MRVLLFCSNFPHSHKDAIVSGVVKNAFNHALSLAQNDIKVSVITDGRQSGKWECNGINVVCVGPGFSRGVVRACMLDILMTIHFLRNKNLYDVVHIHTGNLLLFFALKKLRVFKIPVVYTAHGTTTPELGANFDTKKSFYERLVRLNGIVQEIIDRFMWKNSDLLISVSDFQLKEMKTIYRVSDDRIRTVRNGVDRNLYFPDKISATSLRESLCINEEHPVVVFVGRLVRKKGVHLLINSIEEVLSAHQDVRFVVVGGDMKRGFDSEYVKQLKEMSEPYVKAKKMFIIENVSEEELPAYYNMADVCVFPSLEYESLPTVIYEAMACGKPIITQGSWGTPEVLDDVLLSERQLLDGKLGSEISMLLEDTDRQAALSAINLNTVTQYCWKEIGKEYKHIYEKLIAHT